MSSNVVHMNPEVEVKYTTLVVLDEATGVDDSEVQAMWGWAGRVIEVGTPIGGHRIVEVQPGEGWSKEPIVHEKMTDPGEAMLCVDGYHFDGKEWVRH